MGDSKSSVIKKSSSKRFLKLENCDANSLQPEKGDTRCSTVTISSIIQYRSPCYNVKVRVKEFIPSIIAPTQLVRGHCPYFTCNTVYTNIDWAKSGPNHFGKVLRPYCSRCSSGECRRYLNLFFYLEMCVTDSTENEVNIVVQRESAVRFLGCTVHKFLLDENLRTYIVGMLQSLLRLCSPDISSQHPGLSISISVLPVAVNTPQNVSLQMFGKNLSLYALLTKRH